MKPLSRKYIDDNDVVARYLAHRLSDSERESFEAYYLEHPEVLKELNRTAQFKVGLMDLEASGDLATSMQLRPSWYRGNRMAMAATILLAVGAGVWLYGHQNPRSMIANSVATLTYPFQAKLSIAGSYNIERTRSSSYDATINLPKDAAAVELRIRPERAASPALYRVALFRVADDDSTTKLTTITGLKPASDGFVEIYVNTSLLTPAVYEIRIASDDERANSAASSFLFESVPAPHQ